MILSKWPLVAADLISEYAFNVYDQQQRRSVSWMAAQTMIGGLFSTESRLSRWFEQEYGSSGKGGGAGAGHR